MSMWFFLVLFVEVITFLQKIIELLGCARPGVNPAIRVSLSLDKKIIGDGSVQRDDHPFRASTFSAACTEIDTLAKS